MFFSPRYYQSLSLQYVRGRMKSWDMPLIFTGYYTLEYTSLHTKEFKKFERKRSAYFYQGKTHCEPKHGGITVSAVGSRLKGPGYDSRSGNALSSKYTSSKQLSTSEL